MFNLQQAIAKAQEYVDIDLLIDTRVLGFKFEPNHFEFAFIDENGFQFVIKVDK